MSHSRVAVRSTPVRFCPVCGAAIQPTSTTRMSRASPAAAATQPPMIPVTTSGRPAPGAVPDRAGPRWLPRRAGLAWLLGPVPLARVAEVVTTQA